MTGLPSPHGAPKCTSEAGLGCTASPTGSRALLGGAGCLWGAPSPLGCPLAFRSQPCHPCPLSSPQLNVLLVQQQ